MQTRIELADWHTECACCGTKGEHMAIEKMMVLGAGVMGRGIAEVAANAGFHVLWNDVQPEFVHRGLAEIKKSLDRRLDKNKITAADHQKGLDILNRNCRSPKGSIGRPKPTSSSRRSRKISNSSDNCTPRSANYAARKPFWPRTPPRFRSRPWATARSGRIDSSGCTSLLRRP